MAVFRAVIRRPNDGPNADPPDPLQTTRRGADSRDGCPGDRRCRLHRLPDRAPAARAGARGRGARLDGIRAPGRRRRRPVGGRRRRRPRRVAETVEQYGIDAVVHFAAYKSPGESMIKPQRYFANNVARQYQAPGDAARGRGGSARLLLDLCRLRDAGTGAGRGGRRRPPREPLRGEQGDDREGSGLVRPVPGPALGEPALLQRRRGVARRVDRGGLDRHDQPGPAPHEGGPRAARAAGGLRHRLPDAGRDGDPRLRPRHRPGRRAHQGAGVSRGRGRDHRGQPGHRAWARRCSRSWRQPSGLSVSPCPTSSRPPARGSRGALRRHTRSKEVLGWSARHGLDEILASAWAWHSTHLDGYGD